LLDASSAYHGRPPGRRFTSAKIFQGRIFAHAATGGKRLGGAMTFGNAEATQAHTPRHGAVDSDVQTSL
jgi:catalase